MDAGSPMRRAALLVHAMERPDRDWVLGQLAPDERDQLATMLAELRELGIPAERELLKQAVAEMPPASQHAQAADPPRENAPSDTTSPQAMLRRADPALIARALRAEPPALVAAVLALEPWPWREAVLAQLGVKRAEVGELLAPGSVPAARLHEHAPAAVARRIEELARSVATQAADHGRPAADGGVSRERHVRGWRHLLGRFRPGASA